MTYEQKLAAKLPEIKQALQEIVEAKQKQWDCAFALGFTGPGGNRVKVSAGNTKAGLPGQDLGTPITPDARFAWGSVTKMVTGVSIIRLANQGAWGLHDRVAPILDPYLQQHGVPPLAKLFGKEANRVTIYQLATMTAGVPDYDTAKPNETDPSASTDSFRQMVYDGPGKDWTPFELLQVPWVNNGTMEFAPGTDCDYSSTNFVLLGLLLAAHAGVPWDKFDQTSFRPPAAVKAGLLNNSAWAAHGAPDDYTDLHGYDRTSYNHQNDSKLPGRDVSAVHGVFGGWTASDIVAPVQDIADLAFDIYGPESADSLVTREDVQMMTNTSRFYGFSTFLLSEFTGQPTDAPVDYGTCWGHLGATYGWNSVVQFMPGLNISMAIGTNVESDQQAQPSDAFCVAYNRVKQIILDEPRSDCVYDGTDYFGNCICPGNKYYCHRSSYGAECRISYHANLTYESCEASCK